MPVLTGIGGKHGVGRGKLVKNNRKITDNSVETMVFGVAEVYTDTPDGV